MPSVKRPTAPRVPKVDDKFTLDVIEGKIKDFVKFVKVACVGVGKDKALARDRAKFLVRDLMELKKEKSPLITRSSAIELLYKNFAEWVEALPEGMKKGAHPKKVVLAGNKKCPKGCNEDYHETLIEEMGKAKNYSFDPSDNSWTPDFGKQTGHADGKNWKAYVDAEDGKGTKWRLGFSMAFEQVDEVLTVTINWCKLGH
jgi:hypothetical protein